MSAPDPRRLGIYLWRSSLTEKVASGLFHAAGRSPLLTRAQRGLAALYAEEESTHGDILRESAKQYLPTRPDEAMALRDAVDLPVHLGLAWVYQAERISRPGFAISQQHFLDIGDHDTAERYLRIYREEGPHIAFGAAFLRHLKVAWPALHAEVLRFWVQERLISRRYRQVAAERPWAAKEKGAEPGGPTPRP